MLFVFQDGRPRLTIQLLEYGKNIEKNKDIAYITVAQTLGFEKHGDKYVRKVKRYQCEIIPDETALLRYHLFEVEVLS